ncbi:hypothetical protein SODALDRAFT_343891 [Sodiomyces alkalinus F11]|uniref:RTA1 domain-containing protein n=1 Tax=Sodiomyces alkalinus (strain CBS 110278 / VKM F-3762 / F11) TaxID=1314773 RepID=A0A3N2PZP7_SODAK|nr:hypothetical protein SODALDRAFT_343891 [Sodiomyces alkalinus F11]ROT39999.1 hypothetical protein SODALDRAFT_343891 [Sodiomyces alkalinus F11]
MAEPGEPVLFSLYVYQPNTGAAIFFTIAYAVSGAFHVWQCRRYNAWRLIGLHPLCGLTLTAGYGLRIWGSYNFLYKVDDVTPLIMFILSQCFIYICPPLLELANYHILGRIFYYVPHCSPFPPGKVLAFFGGLMLLVELLNGLGVALFANPSSGTTQQSVGGNMTIAAVTMQLMIILAFVWLAFVFYRRCRKAHIRSRSVKTMRTTLYTSMALIFIRCVYRLVEHTGHTHKDLDDIESLRELNPLFRFEVFFYIFEASLMLVNSIIWNIWHPGRFLPRDYHVHLGPDGNEVAGEKDEDNRPMWAKVVNAVTFGVMYRRKAPLQQFQELTERPTPSNRYFRED